MMTHWALEEEGELRPRDRTWDHAQVQDALHALPDRGITTLDLGGIDLTLEHVRWLSMWPGLEALEILKLGYTGIGLEHVQALLSGRTPHELYLLELSGCHLLGVEAQTFEFLTRRLPALENLQVAFLEALPSSSLNHLRELAVLDVTFSQLDYNVLHQLGIHAHKANLLEELHMACTGRFITLGPLLKMLQSRQVKRLSLVDVRGCNIGRYQEIDGCSDRDLAALLELEEVRLEGNLLTQDELERLVSLSPKEDLHDRLSPYVMERANIQAQRYARESELAEIDVPALTAKKLRGLMKRLTLEGQDIDAIERWFDLHPS